jgi:hypothetical protein
MISPPNTAEKSENTNDHDDRAQDEQRSSKPSARIKQLPVLVCGRCLSIMLVRFDFLDRILSTNGQPMLYCACSQKLGYSFFVKRAVKVLWA